MISPLLTTDDAVMVRKMTSRWNEGNRYGALGYSFFMMLNLDQHKKVWHYDLDGNRVCTMLRKRNLFMDSIRGDGLQFPREGTSPVGQGEVDLTSFGDAGMALYGENQATGAQLYQVDSARGYPESANDDISFASDGMSPLIWEKCADMGCPKSPDWDSDMEVNSVEEEEGRECVMGHLRNVIEGPPSVPVRAFLVPEMMSSSICVPPAVKWNMAGLHGAFAELFFFLSSKDGKEKTPASFREATCTVRLWADSGALAKLPCLMAQESRPERVMGSHGVQGPRDFGS